MREAAGQHTCKCEGLVGLYKGPVGVGGDPVRVHGQRPVKLVANPASSQLGSNVEVDAGLHTLYLQVLHG